MIHFKRLALGAALLVAMGQAQAQTIATLPVISIETGSVSWSTTQAGIVFDVLSIEQGVLGTKGQFNSEPGAFELDWDFTFKIDPFIVSTIGLNNLSASVQNFTVNATLPTNTGGVSTRQGGSIAVTVIDRNGNSTATLDVSSLPGATPGIYQARIDGAPQIDLLGATLTCSGGPFCSTSTSDFTGLSAVGVLSAAVFGLPGPAVASNIQLQLQFNLSAGDRVQISSLYEVVPVPVPPALPLLGSALAALVLRRRRNA